MPNLRLALRTLWKTPFVTLVAVISLALGIGANAAIFSLFDQILLRPLPVAAPQELVNLAAPGPKPGSQSCNDAGSCEEVFSHPMFRDLTIRSCSPSQPSSFSSWRRPRPSYPRVKPLGSTRCTPCATSSYSEGQPSCLDIRSQRI